jgi:hypothetical protein
MKKDFKTFKDTFGCKDCPTPKLCNGCYEEYLKEKEEVDPYIHNLVSQYFNENKEHYD